ncbi:TPA: AlpA family phage regulatory protein, partial [Vibrio vulnificus]|nr:AlpA family phage regulatory protein [Vibrio vulnificus]HAS8111646.1 AlpA family phage regulatory protein [Vibrio vulnificus]HAS8160964.1 AlpA family phage regulatory protein [Vibrio vulnificus]HAS8160966.1 AlpA family phage regulatory protein [Vibrio vulnificus]
LGFRSVAWVESEVQDWILERVAERDERLGLPMLEQEAVA